MRVAARQAARATGGGARASGRAGPLRMGAVVLVLAGLAVAAGCGAAPPSPSATVRQYSSPGRIRRSPRLAVSVPGVTGSLLSGTISASGGPYLHDRFGRVVLLHGINAVYKRPPYELYVDPGKPWNFSAADASEIAELGFNVVRLGILWEGLEPGHGAPNNPAVCTPGPPGNPHMFDLAVADAYLKRVAQTVDLLARHHIYTLLDMHQDVYSQAFDGEGAPAWAVCTDGEPIVTATGRWSRNYGDPTLKIATDHFWSNDVIGDLQGQFDMVWGVVAHYFRHNPWVVGFDPYNEPFSAERTPEDTLAFAADLQCFYAGRANPGHLAGTTGKLTCPASDPTRGVIGTIEAADPHRLVFVEPDIYSSHNGPNLLGPMDYPNLVLNFHSYCRYRSPVTGEPTNVAACESEVLTTMLNRARERPLLSSRRERGGPAWIMSEFGADHDPVYLDQVTGYADLLELGWIYWSWKYYDDPTGSTDEALASPSGKLAPTAGVLSRPYPEAVAGTPESVIFDPESDRFDMTYAPDPRITEPTIIDVPGRVHYLGRGYCTTVVGGHLESAPGSASLLVANVPGARTVSVTIAPGGCTAARPRRAKGGRSPGK